MKTVVIFGGSGFVGQHIVRRLAKKGFELSMRRSKKLCCVDKANVLESSRLWRETVQSMEKDYPEVRSDFYLDIFDKTLVNMFEGL